MLKDIYIYIYIYIYTYVCRFQKAWIWGVVLCADKCKAMSGFVEVFTIRQPILWIQLNSPNPPTTHTSHGPKNRPGPKKGDEYSNHPFSGAKMLVSGRVFLTRGQRPSRERPKFHGAPVTKLHHSRATGGRRSCSRSCVTYAPGGCPRE